MGFIYFLIAAGGSFLISNFVKRNRCSTKILVRWNFMITFIYIIWRVTVIPTASILELCLGVLLLAGELLGIAQFLLSQLLLSRKYRLKKKSLEDYNGHIPTVDIFICTYNEGEDLVETTVLAALNLDYPRDKFNIYICDDGQRRYMKRLAARCGVNYMTRGSNEGAKAGNLNNALRHSTGELFAVLDADMICSKNFLKYTVGYFSDEDTAFVQTPQVYYNKDMYQRNLGREIPNEQDFFMREIQEARAAVGAVLHVGTNAVFRRKSVMEIGMYPTNTITEDMAVGMLLQAAGYQSVFINEVLVLGLTASTYTDLVIQRDRWCRGNIQTSREYHPLRMKGLSTWQKLAYLGGDIYWYTGFSKMIFTFCPIWFLLTTKLAMQADLPGILTFFLPFFIGQMTSFYAMISNTRSLKWAHYYEIAMAPHMCLSVFREFFSASLNFAVTPKEMRDDRSHFQAQVILPHMVIAAITMFSWLTGGIFLHLGYIDLIPFLVNLVWSIYNFMGVIICIRVAYHIGNTPRSNYATVKSGHKLTVETETESYPGEVMGFIESGMYIHVQAPLYFTKVRIRMQYQELNVILDGTLKMSGNQGLFKYDWLNLNQKRAIVGIYVEHLQPSFNVEKKMHYLEA